ncbi:MAG: hypothetical protein ACPG5B_10315 [Chitinophagales bacterium]
MTYNDFTLRKIQTKFGISNKVMPLFKNIVPQTMSDSLKEDLEIAKTLPVRSEKAKSELIVMPILIEMMKKNQHFFTIYSGDTLTADRESGLQGECDFILAKNTETFNINTPIITLVEAKRDNIEIGIPQCAAQMIGASIYNKKYGSELDEIYGCVTTADNWIFLKLKDDVIFIDNQKYYLGNVEELLGVFQCIVDIFKEKFKSK